MEIDNNFLENFYNHNNDLELVDDWNREVKLWEIFYDLKDSPQLFGLIKNNQIYLYFGSKSKNGYFALNEELKAFFGFYFEGVSVQLDQNDYHENLLSEIFYNGLAFKILVTQSSEGLKEKINTYFKLLKERPVSKSKLKMPFGQIRNLFDQALLLGDAINAEKYKLQMLENNNDSRLTPRHELFLNIRMKSGLDLWDQFNLNDLRKLKDYKDQIPLRIIKDIAKYFYINGIEKFINSQDFNECKKYLKDNLYFDEFLNLFSIRHNSQDKMLLHVLIFAEYFKENYNKDYISHLYDEFKKNDLTKLINTLNEHIQNLSLEQNDRNKIDPLMKQRKFLKKITTKLFIYF